MNTVPTTRPATNASTTGRPARYSFRPWYKWLLTALAFPPSGLIAHLVAGRVDSVPAAVLNGVIAGTGIGAAQWALLRHRGVSLIWIAATAVGLGAGLAAGAALVSYETDITSLAVMGAVSGLGVGIAQGATLATAKRTLGWIAANTVLWALGWTDHHRRRHRRQPTMGSLRRLRMPHPRLPAEHHHRSVRARQGGHVMTADTHVVFGTGPAGRAVASALVDQGARVRMVNRSGKAVIAGVETTGGDATDPAFARDVSADARHRLLLSQRAQLSPLGRGIPAPAAGRARRSRGRRSEARRSRESVHVRPDRGAAARDNADQPHEFQEPHPRHDDCRTPRRSPTRRCPRRHRASLGLHRSRRA